MRERWARFESSAWSDGKVEVRGLDGVDALNRLFRFAIQVRVPQRIGGRRELLAMIDRPASLWFEDRKEVVGQAHGIVSEISSRVSGNDGQEVHLDLILAPRLWSLTQSKGSEIFLDQTIPQVIEAKLRAHGFEPGTDFVLALTGAYPRREFIVQFDETDHAFVSRLCEHVGIATAFDHGTGRDVLVLTDSQQAFHPIARPDLQVRDRNLHPAAFDLRTSLRRTPAKAIVRDYNYRNPRLGLDETNDIPAEVTRGTWTEITSHAKTPGEVTGVAKLRGEELSTRQCVVEGTSTEMSLRAGGVFHLHDPREGDEDLLALEVRYRLRQDEGAGTDWTNYFTAIPLATPYRPERVTPWPRVPGLHNAVVDGEIRGHFAELDDDGRYHVRMQYDRSGRTDLGATHPVRMMQPHAGANYGMHFPLRPGTEVLIGFVNGDPDRPIIVGTAPNPTTESPVQHVNETQNVLRTGSNNEMVIEDLHGSERIRIHSPHKNTTLQLGAQEEAEEGALTTTQAHISEASRGTNNEATTSKTVLADRVSTLVGRNAFVVAGAPAVTAATERGIESPDAIATGDIARDLRRLALPPDERAAAKGQEVDASTDEGAPPEDAGGRLWSALADTVSAMTEESAMKLVRAAAEASDRSISHALGRADRSAGRARDPARRRAHRRDGVARQRARVRGPRGGAFVVPHRVRRRRRIRPAEVARNGRGRGRPRGEVVDRGRARRRRQAGADRGGLLPRGRGSAARRGDVARRHVAPRSTHPQRRGLHPHLREEEPRRLGPRGRDAADRQAGHLDPRRKRRDLGEPDHDGLRLGHQGQGRSQDHHKGGGRRRDRGS